MEVIKDGEKVLCIVYREGDWTEGLSFPTPDEFYIQAGCWQYEAGKKLRCHQHKDYERVVMRTQEVAYVKKGSMKIFVFDDDRNLIKEEVLKTGDFAVMADGGHGYEILEDGTQVLEVKNGPFISVEKDKEVFDHV